MNELRQCDISVLYVEDEAFTRLEIQQFLRRRVREVYIAENGDEGLALFREKHPDVVLTDIRMPVMDGLKMAREIRSLDRDVPIIITTAHSDAPYMMDAIEVGVDQYVIKPVDMEKLSAAIGKCAELIGARRAAEQYQAEREKLIGELQEALSRVKLLSGLLPICSHCKKIRDDAGYWQQIELYIRDHSEAEFSHGLCPDCADKYYSEYLKKQ